MSELPEGWAETSFMDVFDIQGGTQPPKSVFKYEPTEGYIRLLQIRDFGDKPLPTYIPNKDSLKRCVEDDVLIGRYGASVGRICTGMNGAYNVALAKVVVPQILDKRFVFHFLKSELFQRPILDIERSAQDGFNKEDLSEIPLLLPPLNEQRRIVAKLEKLLSRVDAARARLATIPRIVKRFRQSVLAAACSGRLTTDWRNSNETDELDDLPSGWKRVLVEDLLPKGGIFDGPFGSNLKTSDYTPSGVRVIRLENIGQLKFNEDKETYVSQEKYQMLIRHTVREGDIIFASFITDEVRACVLPPIKTKAIAKADCFCLRPLEDLVNPTFLTYQLISQETFNSFIDNIHGATRPRINTTQLRRLVVRVCSLAEQQEIVRRVEALFKTADALEARYRTAKAHVDKLTQSILARAFRGELVTTEAELARREGRDYEPASVLLERIRQERAQQVAPKQKTKRASKRDLNSQTHR